MHIVVRNSCGGENIRYSPSSKNTTV